MARDDVADVAVAVLTSEWHDGKTYDVTGPEAFTLAGAAELSRAWGRSDHLQRAETPGRPFSAFTRGRRRAGAWEIEGAG